jgi:hypothetical protein
VGNKGSNILGAMEVNPAVYGAGATTGNTNARRLYAGMAAMEIATPFQRSKYDSFQFTATKRTSVGLSILGTYVYSKNYDNSSSTVEGSGSYPRSSSNPDIDWGPSDFDVAHRMNLSLVYDVPAAFSGMAGAMLNKWQLNAIITVRSGLPFTVKSGTDRSLTGIGQDNADVVGDTTRTASADPVMQWFNPAAFTAAAVGTYGSSGRNSMRGPGAASVDFAMVKNIPMSSRLKIQFRVESFNLLNRANFNNPNSTVTAGTNFGKILGVGDPRVFQFGLKVIF